MNTFKHYNDLHVTAKTAFNLHPGVVSLLDLSRMNPIAVCIQLERIYYNGGSIYYDGCIISYDGRIRTPYTHAHQIHPYHA